MLWIQMHWILDPDPEFGLNLDPIPDPGFCQFWRKKFKNSYRGQKFSLTESPFLNNKKIMALEDIFDQLMSLKSELGNFVFNLSYFLPVWIRIRIQKIHKTEYNDRVFLLVAFTFPFGTSGRNHQKSDSKKRVVSLCWFLLRIGWEGELQPGGRVGGEQGGGQSGRLSNEEQPRGPGGALP